MAADGMIHTKPTEREIDAAFKEEHDAAIAFAQIIQKEATLQKQKVAVRARLNRAREEKRAILHDLMAL
jgi:hypothetical protein